MPKLSPNFEEVRRALSFDEAIAKLQEAGMADDFVAAIEKDPALQESLKKMAPNLSNAASPGWSCCVTVNNPLRSPAEAVINPAPQREINR